MALERQIFIANFTACGTHGRLFLFVGTWHRYAVRVGRCRVSGRRLKRPPKSRKGGMRLWGGLVFIFLIRQMFSETNNKPTASGMEDERQSDRAEFEIRADQAS